MTDTLKPVKWVGETLPRVSILYLCRCGQSTSTLFLIYTFVHRVRAFGQRMNEIRKAHKI